MLLQILPFNTPIKHLSQADTLQIAMQHMQTRMDSLEKVVMKTEIGTGFFSDVISTNLYMFASIIGLGAFVSWAFIGRMLYLHKKAVEKNLSVNINNLKEEYYSNHDSIKNDLEDVVFNGHRAMYNIEKTRGIKLTAFTWALSASEKLYDIYEENDIEFLKFG